MAILTMPGRLHKTDPVVFANFNFRSCGLDVELPIGCLYNGLRDGIDSSSVLRHSKSPISVPLAHSTILCTFLSLASRILLQCSRRTTARS